MTLPRLLDTSIVSRFVHRRAQSRNPLLVASVNEIVAVDGLRISAVTYYEMLRGLRKLELAGDGQSSRRAFATIASTAVVYGLDLPGFAAWQIAADVYARAAVHSPAIVIEECDLLILATALAHAMVLLTCDQRLAARASELGLGERVAYLEPG